MAKPLRILIVEDSEDDALLLVRELGRGGYDVASRRVELAEDMKAALAEGGWDAVISDYVLPRFSGLAALEVLKESGLDLPFIVVSGNIGEDIAVGAMKAGAHDYLIKGNLRRLASAVERELREAEARRERREAERRIEVTNDALKLFTRKFNRKEYLDAVCELVREWSGCRHVGIRIVDQDGNAPFLSCEGYAEAFLDKESNLSLEKDRCICTRIIAGSPAQPDLCAMTPAGSFHSSNTAKFVEKLTAEEKERYRGVCMKYGFQSLAVIPIRYRDKPIGAIHLADEREGLLTQKTVALLEQLAYIIGEAVFRFGIEDELRANLVSLQATSALLERVFSGIHVLIAYLDRDFNFIRVNRAYAESDGREPEFFPGKNHFDLYPNAENEAIFRRVVETGMPYFVYEKPFEYAERPERGVTYWDWSLAPVKDAGGGVTGLVFSLLDVTERKRTEEKLSLFKNLINQANDAVFLVDAETSRLLEINDAACVSLGYSRDELLAMRVTDFAERQPDPSRWKEHVAEVRQKGYVLLEDRLKQKNGAAFPAEVGVTHVVRGKKDYLVAVVRDITERRRAEEERARLAAAVESAADAVVVTEPVRGTIQYVNSAFERVTGYSREEAVGKGLHILDSGRHDEAFFRELRETLAREGVWRGRLISKRKDGTHYFEDCTFSPVKNSAGEIINYVSVKRDVTERIRLESIAESVNTMDNIGYVFSGVRHEIGNPVNTAKMLLSVLQIKLETATKETVAEYLNRMMNEIGRVEHLLRSLKNFNLFETPELETLDTAAFLDRFLGLISEDFGKKGIELSRELGPGAERLQADPRALQQVLLNLVTNAADALEGRPAPRIGFLVSKKDGRVLLQVVDNGAGMTDQQRQDLFKPFYTSKPKGTGLGLVIVKKMLTKMNGDIEIASRAGRGTTVTISLPEGTDAPAR